MRLLIAAVVLAGGVVLRLALPAAAGGVDLHLVGALLVALGGCALVLLFVFPGTRSAVAGRGRRGPRDAAGRLLDEKPFDGIL